MKKQLFMLGLAVAALAGCTNEEVTDIADSNVIGFGKAFVGNPTKAVAEVTDDNLQNFYVFGYKGSTAILTNEKVYKSGTAWGYNDIQKWEASQTWSFAAYSNAGTATNDGKIDGVTYSTAGGLEITDYTVGTENKDLVASISSTDISTTNTPVQFTFLHTLARVKFTIQSAMGINEVSITDFKVTGAKDKATLTFTSTSGGEISWGIASDARTMNGANGTATTETPYTDEFVVIPQKPESGITIKFSASIDDPEDSGSSTIQKSLQAVVGTDNCDWKAGFCYNYIATIDATDMNIITFELANVEPWADYTDIDAGDLTNQ